MSGELIDELIAIVGKKGQLLDRMHELTRLQLKHIEDENVEDLDQLMDQKGHIMKKIDKLDISFLTIFSRIKEDNGVEDIYQLSLESYPRLKDLKEGVRGVSSKLMSISLLDERNHQNIKQVLKNTEKELRRVRKGREAYKGYNAPVINSILIDEKK